MVKLDSSWHDSIGTSAENSSNREAPNKHTRGGKKYKEMISRDVKRSDTFGNLPIKFSKPPKRTKAREDLFHICDHCLHVSMVSKYRAGHACRGCKEYTSVNKTNIFNSEEEVLSRLETLEKG